MSFSEFQNSNQPGSPLAGFIIVNSDDLADVKYYGYMALNSCWYIMRQDSVNSQYSYSFGRAGYPDVWNNRDTITYTNPDGSDL